MESALLTRIYQGPALRSTWKRPMDLEVAFGAFSRLKTGIIIPGDFAIDMIWSTGMNFEQFASANNLGLFDGEAL